MNIYLVLAILIVAIVVGMVLGLLAEKLKLPRITGYFIGGIILGPAVLNIITEPAQASLSIISDIALGFIAFSIGLELWKGKIKKSGKEVILITLIQGVITALIIAAGVFLVTVIIGNPDPGIALILGAIGTATAPAPLVMIVKQFNAKGPITDRLIPVVGLDDAIGVIIFAVFVSIAFALKVAGESVSIQSALLFPILEIVLSIVVGGISGLILTIGYKFVQKRNNSDKDMILEAIIVSVFLCVAATGLFHYVKWPGILGFLNEVNLSNILVAMAAGTIFTNFIDKKQYDFSSNLMNGFIPPIMVAFFVLAAAHLDFSVFTSISVILVALAYIIFRISGKFFGVQVGALASGSDPKVRKYLGLAMLPQAGVDLGLAYACAERFISSDTGDGKLIALGNEILNICIAGMLFFVLIGPIIAKIALGKAGELHELTETVIDKTSNPEIELKNDKI